MCLLFLYVNDDPDENGYRLVLANNRDEFWDRPTDPVDFRDDYTWVGGADLVPGRENGTWLGISTDGKIAVLLNIFGLHRHAVKGRGSLVRDFLTQDISAEEYTQKISESARQYKPFHLFTVDLRDDCHVHSASFFDDTKTRTSPPGCYGADNGTDIDNPWEKRQEGEKKFSNIVNKYGSIDQRDQLVENITDLLNDKTRHIYDQCLNKQASDVGRSQQRDLILAGDSIFVYEPNMRYGTRLKRMSPMKCAEEFIKLKRDPSFLEKFWVNDVVGWGVKAKEQIRRGDFVAEYVGLLCSSEPEDGDFKFEISSGKKKMWLDASVENGTHGRLINDDHIAPNTTPKLITVDKTRHLCFFALRDICVGEEIRYNYGHGIDFPWRLKMEMIQWTTDLLVLNP